jgi:hypothetical protein
MKLIKEKKLQNGLTYSEYKNLFAEDIEKTDTDTLNELSKKRHEARIINFHRTNRIEKHYNPSTEITDEIRKINRSQFWLVITENWCGDSAQILPVIQKIASINSNIELKIFLRDSNPEIIDSYLTNGTRSIPKLIVFDTRGNELYQWGPRPQTAGELVHKLKAEGLQKEEIHKQLHLWYGRNRGNEVENEFMALIRNSNESGLAAESL